MTVTISLSAIDHDYYTLIAKMRGWTLEQYIQRATRFYYSEAIKEAAQLSNQQFEGKS